MITRQYGQIIIGFVRDNQSPFSQPGFASVSRVLPAIPDECLEEVNRIATVKRCRAVRLENPPYHDLAGAADLSSFVHGLDQGAGQGSVCLSQPPDARRLFRFWKFNFYQGHLKIGPISRRASRVQKRREAQWTWRALRSCC